MAFYLFVIVCSAAFLLCLLLPFYSLYNCIGQVPNGIYNSAHDRERALLWGSDSEKRRIIFSHAVCESMFLVGGFSFAFFVAMAFCKAIDYSTETRLPLSDIGEFVEMVGGDVYIDSRWYNRIFRFKKDGAFVATYPYPEGSSKSTGLAVSSDGKLYFFKPAGAFLVTPELEAIEKINGDYGHRSWELDAEGLPRNEPTRDQEKAYHRPIARGELLRGSWEPGSPSFYTADGAVLTSNGWSVVRTNAAGVPTAQYGTPWYFVPFEAPFPWGLYGLGIVVAGIGLKIGSKCESSCGFVNGPFKELKMRRAQTIESR